MLDMFYLSLLTVLFLALKTIAFLNTVLIPVYDVNTDKRFLFPEEYLRLILEEQALILEGKTEEIAGPLDKEGMN